MKKSRWPKGFPYPVSWLRAIALVESISFWLHLGEPFATTPEGTERLIIFAWLIQVFVMAGYRYVAALLTHLAAMWWPKSFPGYQCLQTRAERIKLGSFWSISREEWREGVNALIVSFLATVFTTVLAVIFVVFISGSDAETVLNFQDAEHLEEQTSALAGIWLAFALALYEYDRWVRDRKLTKSRKPRARSVKPSAPIDPVEQELNKLKAKMGATKMKSVKK
ncbi:hypothetical protein PN499_05420 [Kamptonema animale CS-326]|uniref:hypothetical protein n=1 Tax=Kamptonema animale TaxID=92934 RepID=UPI00232E5CEA|nr:hypothetical protein [Kamptonema animale]MDB9510616.1 hypothetical protein [Kamptonema animale CS-326]